MTATIWAWLGGLASLVALVVGAYFRGDRAGASREQRRGLEARIEAAGARAHGEQDADRAGDPGADLRRDWLRGSRRGGV